VGFARCPERVPLCGTSERVTRHALGCATNVQHYLTDLTRKITRSPVRLHPAKGVLLDDDLRSILRGADELIMTGGRTLLAKILKGSQDHKILELGLQDCPVYGTFAELSIDAIHGKIDQAIVEGYLSYEYDGRLPLLVYTEKGWDIERETYAEELFHKLRALAEGNEFAFDVATLKGRNREMVLSLLDMIEAHADARFIPLLQRWSGLEVKKVRQRIASVIRSIQASTDFHAGGRTT
jgi:hypothetical protein